MLNCDFFFKKLIKKYSISAFSLLILLIVLKSLLSCFSHFKTHCKKFLSTNVFIVAFGKIEWICDSLSCKNLQCAKLWAKWKFRKLKSRATRRNRRAARLRARRQSKNLTMSFLLLAKEQDCIAKNWTNSKKKPLKKPTPSSIAEATARAATQWSKMCMC